MTSSNRRLRAALCTFVVSAALLLAAPAAPAAGQLAPADSAAVLLDAARRLEAQGRFEAAEALYQMVAERFGATPAGIAARDRLRGDGGDQLGQSGRTEMQVWATTYGLWLGIAVPAAFGAEDSPPYGVGLLVGGPTGLLAGRALARSALSPGQTRAITFGGTWGTWLGFAFADMADLGEGVECDLDVCYYDDSAEERFASMIVGGLAGIAAGSLLARSPVSYSVATAANHGALWGTWFGAATAVLADIDDDNALLTTVIGGNAGLLAGAWGVNQLGWSRNRVRMVSVGGLIGGLGGLGIVLIAQGESEESAVGIALAGSVLGLGIAAGVTGGMDSRLGGRGPEGAALLNVDGGRFHLGAPMPAPTLVPYERGGPTEWKPALSLQLFQASFR